MLSSTKHRLMARRVSWLAESRTPRQLGCLAREVRADITSEQSGRGHVAVRPFLTRDDVFISSQVSILQSSKHVRSSFTKAV